MFALDFPHHLLGIGFKRPREENSGPQVLHKKRLDRYKVFVSGRSDDRQMERQIRFDGFRDGEIWPRGGRVHFAKKFELLGCPAICRDAGGGGVETGANFQQFRGAREIA